MPVPSLAHKAGLTVLHNSQSENGTDFYPADFLLEQTSYFRRKRRQVSLDYSALARPANLIRRYVRRLLSVIKIQARWRGDMVRAHQYIRSLSSVPAARRVEALDVIRRRVARRARVASTNSRWTNVRQNRLFNMWQANGNFAQTISGPAS